MAMLQVGRRYPDVGEGSCMDNEQDCRYRAGKDTSTSIRSRDGETPHYYCRVHLPCIVYYNT